MPREVSLAVYPSALVSAKKQDKKLGVLKRWHERRSRARKLLMRIVKGTGRIEDNFALLRVRRSIPIL